MFPGALHSSSSVPLHVVELLLDSPRYNSSHQRTSIPVSWRTAFFFLGSPSCSWAAPGFPDSIHLHAMGDQYVPLPVPELLLASPFLFTCVHGWSVREGLQNSVHLHTCMGRRAIKFLGSALGRDCSCSTMVLHRYVFLLHTGFCTAASSPTCQQTTPVLALEKASTTTATEATTPPMPQLVQERSRGILPFPYC
jgi:hypothetical protein